MSEIDSLKAQLQGLQDKALDLFAQATDLQVLQDLKVAYLGKKGELTSVLKGVGKLPPQDRPVIGQFVNATKSVLAEALDKAEKVLAAKAREARIEAERIDVTLSGRKRSQGALHPVQQGLNEMTAIFSQMGFEMAEGPEIEDEFHNFDALNIPAEHPARAMHDTFFFNAEGDADAKLLRTHTSPVQIRAMQA
ncbi:MAG: phenylalanine--tRNA ligase subunit alpha, partial [Ghiorsea sp.]|nr:phenylalanine--tRNA ligase subunit alpha [Ghiorsea sp.]